MHAVDLLARVRDHYVEQFIGFADEQRRNCQRGAAEVKLRLNGESQLFQNLYCVDFIANEPPEIFELYPDRVLTFAPVAGSLGSAEIRFERLHWDDVVIQHDAVVRAEDFEPWFVRWFDPDDVRWVEGSPTGGIIHSLLLEAGTVGVDFGTAPPEAFWELLAVLEGAGATSLTVTSGGEVEADARS